MLTRAFYAFSVLALMACFSPLQARAQTGPVSAKVSGTGTVTIKRPPEALRMQVQLAVHGKDVKDALAKVKARRDAVKAKLVELGADKETIVAGEPHVSVEDSSRRQQMEMMVRQRMRQQGKRAPKKEEAKPVSLTVDLKAEWPLKGADAEQLFVAAYDIQQKATAELAKLRGTEEASAEEEELAEEMSATMSFDGSQPNTGEPNFVYVARISKEDVAKALASAYEKARAQAAELSQAAGATLGPLEHLANHSAIGDADNSYSGMYYQGNPYAYRAMMQQMQQSSKNDDGRTEAIGADPGQVSVSVSVEASFGFKE